MWYIITDGDKAAKYPYHYHKKKLKKDDDSSEN